MLQASGCAQWVVQAVAWLYWTQAAEQIPPGQTAISSAMRIHPHLVALQLVLAPAPAVPLALLLSEPAWLIVLLK